MLKKRFNLDQFTLHAENRRVDFPASNGIKHIDRRDKGEKYE